MSSSSFPKEAHFALRVGVAFAFLYPPIAAISDPISWASYFPHFLRALPIDMPVLLHGFGVLETIIALWILSGWRIRLPSVVATALLVGIVAFNFSEIDIVFRDVSIAAMTLALALWPKGESIPHGAEA